MESSHTLDSVFVMGPPTPMLIFIFIMAFIGLVNNLIPGRLAKWGYTISSQKIEVDENLPDFYDALKIADKEWFKTENKYS